jgi:diaminohydroxyphosphoribosylaminopyrimidine deaminase/5-amino-6-(5-phosphoribosylamino)uracil reductase
VLPIRSDSTGRISLPHILRKLGSIGIASILVEGGADVYNEFLSERMFDKLYLFIAPRISAGGLQGLSTGNATRSLSLRRISQWNLGGDVLIEAYPD